MKILGIMCLVLFMYLVLFGKITIKKNTMFGKVEENAGLLGRIVISLISSSLLTLILGLPLLGILKLLGV